MHLTYKSHIDVGTCEAMLGALGDTKMYSIAHELGDKDEDVTNKDHDYSMGGYAHTHVFWWWK